ncbi:MAG: diaminopimelate epimerase [Chlorobi bacterium]|nr:diaminopimelate epimerase [Chlorobiota bacterium]
MKFFKYTGAGNDFIIINSFNKDIEIPENEIKFLCNRRFGIGADGLMLLKKHPEFDFEMLYYNSDGSGSTMCGNGGRCIVAFAKKIGIIHDYAKFIASDGIHEAFILENGTVNLKMTDVEDINTYRKDFICDTGSPHYIRFVDDVKKINVFSEGREIRFSEMFVKKGINVNFIETKDVNVLNIRTYERGVESETLACGTGAVASALAYAKKQNIENGEIILNAKGGTLKINFEKSGSKYVNIWLSGPADFVFEGDIDIK